MSRSRVTASALSSNYLIDNIASQFDGKKTVFPVRVGGADYTVADPYQLDIYIGSQLLRPYVAVVDNVFLGTVYPVRQGYTITNSKLVFLNPPSAGLTFFGRINSQTSVYNSTSTVNIFSPLSIMLNS
jgi:hypothetical protein